MAAMKKVNLKCTECGWKTWRKWKKWFSDYDLTCPKCQQYGGFFEIKGKED